jgi:lipoic acid synthetase
VCDEARCPNKDECWGSGTATFLLMGEQCTRNCRFCSVRTAGAPDPPDASEADRVVEAARILGLRHVVLTSVTRDDLTDAGASHFCRVVRAIREHVPGASVEALVPPLDDQGLKAVIEAGVAVLAHNIEVVRRLTPLVRDPKADYGQSLALLKKAKEIEPGVRTKSSLLLGLGETHEEVLEALDDLRDAGVDLVAIGQYLQPTKEHCPVEEYVTPGRWDLIRSEALARGFGHVAAGPFVRTSYRAHEALAPVPVIAYRDGLALQEQAQRSVAEGGPESLIVLTHPPVITLGRQADPSLVTASAETLSERGIEVVRTTRGGEVTFHGPGQLVVYPIVNLERRGLGGRRYVQLLVDAVVATLGSFGIEAFTIEGVIGVFVRCGEGPPAKIAAAGVSISRAITGHGVAVNVDVDPEGFTLIVPCGLGDFQVTSMHQLLDPAPRPEAVAARLVAELRARLGQELRVVP